MALAESDTNSKAPIVTIPANRRAAAVRQPLVHCPCRVRAIVCMSSISASGLTGFTR
jgi:hypothetical protein